MYCFLAPTKYELRQAKVAERDGDYVIALYRWLSHATKGDDENKIGGEVCRIIGKVFAKQALVQPRATIEAVLERLWRTHKTPDKYSSLSTMLKLFEASLNQVLAEKNWYRFAHLTFRARNMILMVDNHLGDTQAAEIYINKQNQQVNRLEADPELFHLVLDFKAHEIETMVNLMAFEAALQKAKAYYGLIQSYKAMWELFTEQAATDFVRSKISIKAEMTLIRCTLLHENNPLEPSARSSILSDTQARLNALAEIVDSPSDISRLSNYQVMCFLKNAEPVKAVSHCLQLHKKIHSIRLGDFDLFWFLRAMNDWILDDNAQGRKPGTTASHIWETAWAEIEAAGHPRDLIWREIALFEQHRGNRSKAVKALVKSKKYSTQNNSPILEHLAEMIDEHRKFINNETLQSEMREEPHRSHYLYQLRLKSPY